MAQSPYLGGLIYGYRYIQSSGTLQSQHDTLNFTGTGVTVTDDSPNGRTNVNITAGSSAINGLVGDVRATGPGTPSATVVGLQTFPISTTAPSLSTNVLTWNGVWYAPAASGGGGSVPTGSGFTHITSGSQDAAASHGTADQVAFTNHAGTDIAWATVGTDITMLASGVANVIQLTGSGGLLSLINGTSLQITGATPVSGTGKIRASKDFSLKYRNSSNASDVNLISCDGSDNINIGTSSGIAAINISANTLQFYAGSGASYFDAPQVVMRGGGHATYTFVSDEATGSIQLFSSSVSVGSGVGVLAVANAGTPPSTNPTGGGILFADSGAGKWRGSSGTITTFGPAEPHCPVCGSDFTTEHESPVYGYLAICLVCLADELGDRPWIRRAK